MAFRPYQPSTWWRRGFDVVAAREVVRVVLLVPAGRAGAYRATLEQDGWNVADPAAPDSEERERRPWPFRPARGPIDRVVQPLELSATRKQSRVTHEAVAGELTWCLRGAGLEQPISVTVTDIRPPKKLPPVWRSERDRRSTLFAPLTLGHVQEGFAPVASRWSAFVAVARHPVQTGRLEEVVSAIAVLAGAAIMVALHLFGIPTGRLWRDWSPVEVVRTATFLVALLVVEAYSRRLLRKDGRGRGPVTWLRLRSASPGVRRRVRVLNTLGFTLTGAVFTDALVLPVALDAPPWSWSAVPAAAVIIGVVVVSVLLRLVRRSGWRWRTSRTVINVIGIAAAVKAALDSLQAAYLSGVGVPVRLVGRDSLEIAATAVDQLLVLAATVASGGFLAFILWTVSLQDSRSAFSAVFKGFAVLLPCCVLVVAFLQQIEDVRSRGAELARGEVPAGQWGGYPAAVCIIPTSLTPQALAGVASEPWYLLGQRDGQALFMTPRPGGTLVVTTVAVARVDWTWAAPSTGRATCG